MVGRLPHMESPDNVVYWFLEIKVESRDTSTSNDRWHRKIKAATMSQDFEAPLESVLLSFPSTVGWREPLRTPRFHRASKSHLD